MSNSIVDYLKAVFELWRKSHGLSDFTSDPVKLLATANDDTEGVWFTDKDRQWLGAFVALWETEQST